MEDNEKTEEKKEVVKPVKTSNPVIALLLGLILICLIIIISRSANGVL